MGLQAWYPLVNDMRNQGVGDTDLVVETTPTFGVGKIGNALISGGNSHWTAAQSEKVLNNNAISICFWVYVDAPEGDTQKRAMFFGNNNKRKYALFQYPSCNDFHLSWASYDSSNTGKTICTLVLSGALPSYEWTHVAVTYSNPNGAIYINGEKKRTFGGVINNYTFSDQTQVIHQCEYRKLNDFRIYDHALSPLEVKEISKGLVLHYPLSMPGGENIIKNSQLCSNRDTWISGGTPLASEFTTKEGFDCIHITGQLQKYFTLTPYYTVNTTRYLGIQANGNIYTLSFDVLFDNVVKGTTNYYVTFYKSGETIDGTWRNPSIISNSGHFTSATSDNLDPVKLNGKGWQRVYITIQFGNYAWANSNYVFQLYLRDFLGDVYIKNAKVELGDHATPWIPNPADTKYAVLGFNDGIEYDISGYNHNGTKYGVITYDADTPRYKTSAVFNGSSDIRTEKGSFGWFDFKEGTVAAWFKPANTTQTWASVGVQNDSGAGSRSFSICNYSGKAAAVVGYDSFWGNQRSDYSMSANTWYHLCATITNGDTVKLYVNGELVQTRTVTNTTGKISSNTQFAVGVDLPGSDERFTGQLSDVRFYTTCLNESDVRDLYAVGASLSDTGVLFSNEVSEV